jgi:peptidoglycan/LPS O-acetylase OafA/YrhL
VRTPLQRIERVLIPVGVISYSLYLWHEPTMILVDRAGFHLGLTHTPLAHVAWDVLVTSLIVATISSASYYFLEVGAPKAIRRFMTRRHLAAPPLPGPAAAPLFQQE